MNQKHTQEPWPYYIDVAQNMTPNPDGPDAAVLSFEDYERARICVNRLAGISDEDIENPAIALLHDEPSSELVLLRMEVKELRRKCENIPDEVLNGKPLAEYVADQAFLTGVHAGKISLEGLGPSMISHHIAGMIVGVEAPNYLEMAFNHPEAGNITVTIQKEAGKTPHMLRLEAEQQRDKLLAAFDKAKELLKGWAHLSILNEAIAEVRKAKGQCYFAPDGTLMNADGTRSIFDDVDQ